VLRAVKCVPVRSENRTRITKTGVTGVYICINASLNRGNMGKAIDATLFAIASGTDECESNVTFTPRDVWMKRPSNANRNSIQAPLLEKVSATVSIAINIKFDVGTNEHPELCSKLFTYTLVQSKYMQS